ncbi:hypothetical protein Tco_0256114 [Tanacetum coccineum]
MGVMRPLTMRDQICQTPKPNPRLWKPIGTFKLLLLDSLNVKILQFPAGAFSSRLERRQPQVRQTSVESSNLEKPDNPPIVTMADNRTMAQLLEAPTEGYEDAIVIPEITANNFEIKHGLLNLVQNKQFFGNDKEDPHAHIRYFNKITSTMKIPNVPNTSVKLMLFPFSLEGAARIWLEKEPLGSIETG